MFKNLVHIFDGSERPAPEHCDKIVEIGNKFPLEEAKIGRKEDGKNKKSFRRSEVRWIPPQESMVTNLIWYYANIANRQSFGVDVSWVFEIQLTTYHGVDAGYYDWHQDCFLAQEGPAQRKLSFIMQLSDPSEYEGGDLMFTRQYSQGWNEAKAQTIKEKGTVIIFPSFYTHQITPVTKGTRRSLVSWVEGPAWR